MSDSLFSPRWYRIAGLHPQLRPDVRARRKQYRNQGWHLLSGTASGRMYRVNDKAYQFIGRCDGRHSVQEIWDTLLAELGDAAPTQDEVISTLNQVDGQGLLSYEVVPDADELEDSVDSRRKQRRKAFVNPFAMRIPLGNPSAVLKRLEWLGALIINTPALWLWAIAVTMATVAALANWSGLIAHAIPNLNTSNFMLIAWLCYPLIKLLHELGHGLAVRRWGGEVREAGFSLLVLVPAPYVDASASAAFRDRRHRMIVGAIGIMVELAIAAIAIAVWVNVQPGLVRDVALVTAFIASVSTLLFNGNPLLSFDGYYVLGDMIDVPNLAPRSKRYWGEMLLRFARGGGTAPPARLAYGEKKWLLMYAPLSYAYRLFISVTILLWIAGHSLLLAAAASAFMGFMLLVKPVWGAIQRVRSSVPTHAARWRIAATSAAVLSGLVAIVVALPLPHHTVAQGVVWLPEHAQVRAGTDGFVLRTTAHDGDRVTVGQQLVVMEDPELIAEREQLSTQLEALQVEQFSNLITDTAKSRRVEEDIASLAAQLQQADERIARLNLRAQVDGVFVLPNEQDLPNTFARQGTTLGYVLDRGEVAIRAVVPEYDALLVRESASEIEVRIADVSGEMIPAVLLREVPAATNQLPSAALGSVGGGSFSTDPADSNGLRVLEPVVTFELQLPETELARVGARAWIRFDHGSTPLAVRWHRRLRQVFLQHISPERA